MERKSYPEIMCGNDTKQCPLCPFGFTCHRQRIKNEEMSVPPSTGLSLMVAIGTIVAGLGGWGG